MIEYPKPSQENAAKGWKIDPSYLKRIASLVAKEWARPDLETVQGVLLAHAKKTTP